MNEPTHKEVRANNDTFCNAVVPLNHPSLITVNNTPTAKVALKSANKEEEGCHQECSSEEHWPPTPLINV
jgi:hypothetical protein